MSYSVCNVVVMVFLDLLIIKVNLFLKDLSCCQEFSCRVLTKCGCYLFMYLFTENSILSESVCIVFEPVSECEGSEELVSEQAQHHNVLN